MRLFPAMIVAALGACPALAQTGSVNGTTPSDFGAEPAPLPLNGAPALVGLRSAPTAYPTMADGHESPRSLGDVATSAAELLKDPEAQAIFTALYDHGCRISALNLAPTLAPLGFSEEATRRVFTDLELSGLGSVSADGQMAVSPALCPPPEPVPAPRDHVLAAFRDNGCTLSEDKLRTSVPGVAQPQLQAILGPMEQAGVLKSGDGTATLGPPLCGAAAN